jgi:NAD(P)-dependent dehydrogenase (short-subunit alcohol dehydrogenase family)
MTAPALSGRTFLVTGGAGGIGSAVARLLVRADAAVVIADIDERRGAIVVDELRAAGGSAAFVRCDVTRSAEVHAAVDRTVAEFGSLDGAANIAGKEGPLSTFAEYDEAAWHDVVGVNLTGVFLSMQAELAVMAGQGNGAIVNMASISGLVGGRGLPPYNATKHGVLGLTKAAALEYADQGVRVNAVCPAFTDTDMIARIGVTPGTPAWENALQRIPVHRVGQPVEIARAVLWLLSDESSFVTGTYLATDGGYTAQ